MRGLGGLARPGGHRLSGHAWAGTRAPFAQERRVTQRLHVLVEHAGSLGGVSVAPNRAKVLHRVCVASKTLKKLSRAGAVFRCSAAETRRWAITALARTTAAISCKAVSTVWLARTGALRTEVASFSARSRSEAEVQCAPKRPL